jgi:hypothetical protein
MYAIPKVLWGQSFGLKPVYNALKLGCYRLVEFNIGTVNAYAGSFRAYAALNIYQQRKA